MSFALSNKESWLGPDSTLLGATLGPRGSTEAWCECVCSAAIFFSEPLGPLCAIAVNVMGSLVVKSLVREFVL